MNIKNKIIMILSLTISIFYFNVIFEIKAQSLGECGTETDFTSNDRSNSSCTHSSDAWLNKYRTPGYWIPDAETPIKTVLVNWVILQKDDGTGGWIDSPDFRSQVDQVFSNLNQIYSNSVPKQYPLTCEPTIDFITDTKIRFELKEIIFIRNTTFHYAQWAQDFEPILAYLEQHYPDSKNAMNHFFTMPPNQNNYGIWGYYSVSQAHNEAFVNTWKSMWSPSVYYEAHVNHIAHEYGHALGLHHTYDGEYRSINHYDFLDDIFGLCAEPSCSSCNPSSNQVCYLTSACFWNNQPGPYPLMAGRPNPNYISPKYAGRMHRALSCYDYYFIVNNKPMHKYIKEKLPYSIPLSINQNEVWDFSIKLYQDIVIEPGNTLTINCEVLMPEAGRIIVKPGAKLLVNGGKITSAHERSWQGIEVWGNREANQWPNSSGVYMQGYVELNNAIIENAYIALDLWKSGDYTKTGGIVFANNTDFRNNWESVHALYYENHHPVNGKPMDYQAVFTNCTFNITDSYKPQFTFYKHIDLYQVNGVKFNGCDFGLSPIAQGVSTYNQAIASYSAGFKVNAICEEYSQNGCVKYDPCTFTGFRTAIEASNTSNLLNTFYVNRAEFYDNSNGISVNSVKFPVIINSDFHLSNNQFSTEPCSYGVYLNRSIGFGIEENEFFKTTGAPQADYLGIGVVNCPTVSEIYKNELTGLSAGNYAFGKNWDDDIYKGLAYFCNKNIGNFSDFYVTGVEGDYNQGIQSKLGSTAMPAGNEFSPTGATWHFYNSTKNLIGYYYCSSCPNQYPTLVENVTREPVNVINPCSSHYGGTTGRSIVMDAQQKLDTEIAFASAANNCNNVESLYNSLKDGGSTNVKVSEISSATAADMWTLRAGLLGDSPHLSEEVLKLVSDKTDVFTEAAIFDILAANPDELKKEELIKYLEEKENPLPTYMIDILKQVAEGTTYKTVLQQEISRYSHNKVRAANDMIRSILNDEVLDVSLLRNWLDNLGGIEADKQIISTYLQENNFTSAFALANLLPQLYNLLGDELAEHNRYINLLQLQQTLFTQGRTMAQLTTSEQEMLNEFALTGQGGTAAQAKAILEAFYDQHFSKCESLQGTASYKNHPINANQLGEAYGLSITVKPNPATDFAAFDYTLPNEETTAVLVISNSQGVIVETLNLSGNRGQKLWDTRSISSGSYIYTLKVAGFTKSGKLVIAN